MRPMTMTALRLLATVTLLTAFAPTPMFAQAETRIRIGQGIEPPRKIVHVSPVYPAVAQAARVQGVVILEATIDRQGRVVSARVLRSIPLLDQAAIDAVRQWQYVPTSLNGVPVPVIMTVTVNFTLTGGSAQSSPSSMPTITSYPGEAPGAPHSSAELPTTPQSPMLPKRPSPVFIGDADFMKSYQDTMQTLQKEADSDPELQRVLRNLQRMIEANGVNASLPSSPFASAPTSAGATTSCVSP